MTTTLTERLRAEAERAATRLRQASQLPVRVEADGRCRSSEDGKHYHGSHVVLVLTPNQATRLANMIETQEV